jgi:DNA-binding transcriptional ArsR family regulator
VNISQRNMKKIESNEKENSRLIKDMITFLKFLSNQLRLKIFNLLQNRKLSLKELSSRLDTKDSRLKENLDALLKLGILTTKKKNNEVYYMIGRKKIFQILTIINSYCSELTEDQKKYFENLSVLDTLL